MDSWEFGPTPYAGPNSPARQNRAEPGALGARAAPLWLDVVDETSRVCTAYGRADLAGWLDQRRAQLLDPHLRVLVVGAAKQGKSQLINALVNAPVCAVGDDAGTTVPVIVRHARTPAAYLVRRASVTADWTAIAGPQDRVPLPVARLGDGIDRLAAEAFGGRAELVHADVGVPRGLLAAGLTLIDTPALPEGAALGGPGTPNLPTLAAHARADLVLLACEATRELSTPELELLVELGRLFPNIVVAQTKTDLSPHWRRILARNRQCLLDAGVPATVVAVSAALRLHAARGADAALNAESGFPDLVAHLRRTMAVKPDQLTRATAALLGRIAIEQLATPLRAELAAHQRGTSSDAAARLHETQRRVDQLRRCATRWQNLLSDESVDLMSDVEHDLRERTRAILSEAEQAFDTVDPLRGWDTLESWLRESLRDSAEASFTWLDQRADWLARRIANEFPADAGDVAPRWIPGVPDDLPDRVSDLRTLPLERVTASQKVFTGLRSSYGGVLMFGLATTMAGMPLINPISIGAGAVFGGKGIRDESRQTRKRRQAVARAAVQRHVDEVFVALNKDARDTVRTVQRALRDHFSAVTENLQEAIVESLRSAKEAADLDRAAREQRIRRIQHDLGQLAELYAQVQTVCRPSAAAVPAQRNAPL